MRLPCPLKYIKKPEPFGSGSRNADCLGCFLEVGHVDGAVEQATVLDQFLAVTGHDALVRREAVRVEHGRSAQQRDVRSVEVTGVEDAGTLEAQEDLAVREQRILVELHLALNGAHVHDANIHTFGGESIGSAEVVQLLELAGDVGAHHHPVGGATQSGPMDDVGNLKDLVHQGDVTVGEVNRGTGSGGEIVARTDAGADDQIVDDFTIDLGDHLVGHQVGQGALGVDVVDSLEVLSSFEGPGGLELAGDGADAITVDAQGDLWLEGIGFQVVLVVNASNGTGGEATSAQGDLNRTGGVVEFGLPSGGVHGDGAGELGAVTDQDGVGSAVAVEADAQAGSRIVAIRSSVGCRSEDLDDHSARQNGTVGQRRGDLGTSTVHGSVFATDLLAGVVRVKRKAVIAAERLGSVLPHDLGAGDRLALGQSVTIADVENQAGRLAHRLDADQVVSDQTRIALADEGQSEAGEVSDVRGGGLIFEDHRTLVRIPRLVLVLKDGSHQAHLLRGDLAALAKNRAPLLDELVLLGLVKHLSLMRISGFGHNTFSEVTLLAEETALVVRRQHGNKLLVKKRLNQVFVNGSSDVGHAESRAVRSGQGSVAMSNLPLLVLQKGSSRRDRLHRTLADIEFLCPFRNGSRAFVPLLERSIFGYQLPVLTQHFLGNRRLAICLFDSAVALFISQLDLSLGLFNDCTGLTAALALKIDAFKHGIDLVELLLSSGFSHGSLFASLGFDRSRLRFAEDLKATSEFPLVSLRFLYTDLFGLLNASGEVTLALFLDLCFVSGERFTDGTDKLGIATGFGQQVFDLIHINSPPAPNSYFCMDSYPCIRKI